MAQNGISFTCVIVQNPETQAFYGMVKEVDGVVVKGKSEEEVKTKIPKAIKAIMSAKRKHANETKGLNDSKFIVSEYEQNYVPC